MKININKIPLEGLTIDEEVDPAKLDLDTDIVKIRDPIKLTAQISRITNALTADLTLDFSLYMACSCCLKEFKAGFQKNLMLSYPVSNSEPVIDLYPDIRDEIVLSYPMRPLCSIDCKGLCFHCGKNLNEGECNCK